MQKSKRLSKIGFGSWDISNDEGATMEKSLLRPLSASSFGASGPSCGERDGRISGTRFERSLIFALWYGRIRHSRWVP